MSPKPVLLLYNNIVSSTDIILSFPKERRIRSFRLPTEAPNEPPTHLTLLTYLSRQGYNLCPDWSAQLNSNIEILTCKPAANSDLRYGISFLFFTLHCTFKKCNLFLILKNQVSIASLEKKNTDTAKITGSHNEMRQTLHFFLSCTCWPSGVLSFWSRSHWKLPIGYGSIV